MTEEFSKELQRVSGAWAYEAIESYRPYLPEQMPDLQRQAASLFFYVYAIDPKTESGTVCELLSEAWKEPSEQKIDKAVDLLKEKYRFPESWAYYLPNLFQPIGKRNFIMRQCVTLVLRNCREKKARKNLSQTEMEICEARCRHLVHARDQIKEASVAAEKLQNEWTQTHIFSTAIRLRKDQMTVINNFLADPNPKDNPEYGKYLKTFMFKDGATLSLLLECADNQEGQSLPALVARLTKDTYVVQKAFFSSENHRDEKMAAGDCTYRFTIDPYDNVSIGQTARLEIMERREYMKLEYPENLASEILGVTLSDKLSDPMKTALEQALDKLDERTKNVILLRFRDGKIYREIGERYQISDARIRPIINLGIRKLRTIRLCRILKGEAGTTSQPTAQDSTNKEILMEDGSFSARLYNCLRRAGIVTLEDLQNTSWSKLSSIRNFGDGCRKELEKYCEAHQISLRE